MAPLIEHQNPPAEDLTVRGALPAGLNGQLLGIGPDFTARHGIVHSIDLHHGRMPRYRSRAIHADAVAERPGLQLTPGPRRPRPDIVADNVVTFGGAILALGNGTLAYELTPDLATLRAVDLGGQSRRLAAFPKHDTVTGELHLLAIAVTGARAHVVVSAGALTRRSRTIDGGPNGVTDLAITADRVVFGADGFVGIAARHDEAAVNWIATGTTAPRLVHAHDAGERIVALVVTPSLERWTLHPASGAIHRDVLNGTPQRSVQLADRLGQMPHFAWTTGDHTVVRHDLNTAETTSHCFQSGHTPSGFAFVADPARADDPDGGWLVGFVHLPSRNETDLVVLDAADIARPAIATVRITRRIPPGLHSTWIPRPQPMTNQGDTP
jgi:carotenoid cleavage dioxygenase-like enzyme